MDISYLRNYFFNESNLNSKDEKVRTRAQRNLDFCNKYFLKLFSQINSKLTGKKLIKHYASNSAIHFYMDNKPFAEVFYGSVTSDPYVSFGTEYQKIYSCKTVYEVIKAVKEDFTAIIKFIQSPEDYDKNLSWNWQKDEAHLNERILSHIEKQMLNYIESNLGIAIEDFWKSKENLKKIWNLAPAFCAQFFKEPYHHLCEIIDYILLKKENTTGYIIYPMICNRYNIPLDQSDYDWIAKNIHESTAFVYHSFKKAE